MVDEVCAADANFHAGAFWKAYAEDFLTDTNDKPAGGRWTRTPTAENWPLFYRATERASKLSKRFGDAESPFRLYGARQVGRGGLAGMRMLRHLREQIGAGLAVWPFDGDDAVEQAGMVVVEMFPRLFIDGPKKLVTWVQTNPV
jgi:hypothetical protein